MNFYIYLYLIINSHFFAILPYNTGKNKVRLKK